MAAELGPIVATLKGETKDFERAMQRSNEELLALGAGSVAMGNIATQAFNYLAAGAINAAGTLHRWAEEAAGAAERTQILSMKMGISQTTLEGWGAALKRVGLDQESLAGGMKTLSKNIEGLASGSEKSVELFGKLNTGLSTTELASLGTEQAIRLIADRFAGMADGAEKASLAQQLLGRAGLQLIPVLNEGSAGLDKATKDAEKFGLVLTETQRGALLKYDDSLDNLSLALEGFKKQVAAAFAPSLTRTIEMMTSAVSYAKSIYTEFANAAEKLFIRFGAIAAVIEIVGKQIFSLSVLNKEAWEQGCRKRCSNKTIERAAFPLPFLHDVAQRELAARDRSVSLADYVTRFCPNDDSGSHYPDLDLPSLTRSTNALRIVSKRILATQFFGDP